MLACCSFVIFRAWLRNISSSYQLCRTLTATDCLRQVPSDCWILSSVEDRPFPYPPSVKQAYVVRYGFQKVLLYRLPLC